MRTPLLVIGGMDAPAMAATAMSLMWDLPNAVAVQHRIDPETQMLSRAVSDISGNLEHHETQLVDPEKASIS